MLTGACVGSGMLMVPHIWPLLSGFGYFRDWGLSRAGCGKVGSAHEHFCDETKVMFNGYRGACEVREWILAALQVEQQSWSLEPSEGKVRRGVLLL